MRDGPLRAAIKRTALIIYTTDLKITRAVAGLKGEPAFKLGGNCQLCAACCEEPSVQLSATTYRFPRLRGLIIRWHKYVNGFELKRLESQQKVLVFRCTHFDPDSRRCDSYHTRPGMCRDYPRNLLYHQRPEFLPGCGYSAINKKGDQLLKMLSDEELTPEARKKIDEVFYLEKKGEDANDEPT